MICSVKGAQTYVEEEPAVDHLVLGGDLGQVRAELVVLHGEALQVGGVELLVARDVDGAQVAVGEELLPAGEGVAHELHRAVVVGREVQLALDGQDDVEVLLGLHEVAQVGRHHLGHAGLTVGEHVQVCDRRLLLLLLLLLLQVRLSSLLEGLVVVVRVPDEVRDEGLAHQAQFVLHHEAGFVWFHYCEVDTYNLNWPRTPGLYTY